MPTASSGLSRAVSPGADQVLTVAQMRAAEAALIAAGISVDALMQRAGLGAADYVHRIAAGRAVTILCGPGNNGGDGYVIAQALHARGVPVRVIAPLDPVSGAAREARALYQGPVSRDDDGANGAVLVDCLFGSGLTRPLGDAHLALLQALAAAHPHRVAVDLPSGVESDSGAALNPGLPTFQLTMALGAWKPAHFLMPACATMGALRLVDIGCEPVPGAARVVCRPHLNAPAADAHKYTRGLLGVVGGAMPGAAVLAATAAQRAGAGYVRLFVDAGPAPADLVTDGGPLAAALGDPRLAAVLAGPGLGRDAAARARLGQVLACGVPGVLDADALMLLAPGQARAPLVATPHDGELAALEQSFGLPASGARQARAQALAAASGMVVVAKGPATVIAAPDGRLAFARRASSWLSVAGTGDVLAGTIASRLASGVDPFDAACEGVWLHGEATRLCPAPFTAGELAATIGRAYAACL